MKVYFDNAATTALHHDVVFAINEGMRNFGNPSSTHSFGRSAKAKIEGVRKQLARLFNAEPGEFIFTSGGTEAINLGLRGAIEAGLANVVITSRVEHSAVLETLKDLSESRHLEIFYVGLLKDGSIDLRQLKMLVADHPGALVCLMHANNETGNITSINRVAKLCKKFDCTFFSDTVQTVGKLRINLQETPVDMMVCSAHKFHGPKGAGFLYVRKGLNLIPQLTGGGQERGMRSGTEDLASIAGLGKALEIAYEELDADREMVADLKNYMIDCLKNEFEDIQFNGSSGDSERSLYSILNVAFPGLEDNEMLLFQLDIEGIAASSGSACSSGASVGSRVLDAMGVVSPSVRFSFSKYNKIEEVDYTVQKLVQIIKKKDKVV